MLWATAWLFAAAPHLLAADNAPQKWALLVGVEQYTNLEPLRYAANDTHDLAAQLVAVGIPKKHVFVLDSAADAKNQPLRENILQRLDLVAGRLAQPGDLLIVTFIGHGVKLDGKSYLCPAGANLEKPDETLIGLDRLYASIEHSQAMLKLLVVDACRNDPRPAGARDGGTDPSRGFSSALERPPAGLVVMAGCGEQQKSYDEEELRNGVFTHFLLEGLRGKAADSRGSVSLLALHDYTRQETKAFVAQKHSDDQSPALWGRIGDAFEICRIDPAPPISPNKPDQSGKVVTNSIGMKLVLIPSGEFLMGSPDSEKDRTRAEGPQHKVKITNPFYMGVYEVTQHEYEKVMGRNPSFFSKTSGGKPNVGEIDTSDFPVEQVSWAEANEFCQRLSGRLGEASGVYRLPTEAEWEYAARAGSQTAFPWGDSLNGTEANCNGSKPYGTSIKGPFLGRTARKGSYAANPFGLHDMIGNVFEWCSDWYDNAYYAQSPSNDPRGPDTGSLRVTRGGDWNFPAVSCRSADRYRIGPGLRSGDFGFRVVRVP